MLTAIELVLFWDLFVAIEPILFVRVLCYVFLILKVIVLVRCNSSTKVFWNDRLLKRL